eukprot:SAG31_NODE_5153_length_2712_cov_2.029851_2_plen_175_part_00
MLGLRCSARVAHSIRVLLRRAECSCNADPFAFCSGLPTSGEYASQSYYNNPHSRKRKGDWATLGQRAPHMVSKSAASEGHRLASNGDGFRVLGSSRLADCTTLGSGSSNALRELNHHVDQHVARLQQQLQLQPPSWPSNSCHAILEAQARATMVCEGSGPSAAESSSIVTMKMD